MVDGHHELWVALRQGGVYRLRDGTWTPFRPPQAITPWSTIKLVEQVDEHGHDWLWVASNQGVGRYDGQRWDLLGDDIGLTDLKLRGMSLLTDARRHAILWAGSTDRGMERIDVTDPLHPVFLRQAGLPPPPSPTAYDAQRDSQGRIYICTNNGVQVLTPAGDHFASQVYRRRDGMLHEECNTNARQIDAHDRFWTGTLGGLTVFDPKFGVPDRQSKPLAVTGVTIDGRPVTGDVVVDHQVRELRISYAMLSWQRDDESRFRTQLLGYEAEPGPWTANSARSFSALPPGRYVFRVEGRDYAANFSKPAELALEILPAWWQRGVAQVSFVLAGMLVAYGLVALRTRSLRAQQRHLEEQIAERTGELHAANERLRELSYEDELTGLANRRQLLERLSHPTHLGNETALIFVDVDHFKAYNDRYGHPAGDEALRSIAEVLRSCSPLDAIVARYGGEEFAVLLPDLGRQPALELAEAIRRSVEAFRVPVPGTELINRVSISAGVASARLATPNDTHALLRDADKALYQAKRDGRNCVRSQESEEMA
jgi:diguanylate cyclase (GGDEF)-like protein